MTDDIEHLKLLARGYDLLALFLGGLLVLTVVILSFYYTAQHEGDMGPEVFYLFPIIEICIAFTDFANMYIKYFGVPLRLTFGSQIGRILPATCEASMPVEGARGLPCSLKRFMEWAERARSGDGDWHLDELESDWRRWMFYAGLFGVVAAVCLGLGRFAKFPEPTKQECEQAAEEGTEGEKVRG